MNVVYSIVESPRHPNLTALYTRLGLREIKNGSMRQALKQLKKNRPDFVVADFLYGYGNNYAGVNVSNLDVFLCSLPKYAADARVIVLVDSSELKFVTKLTELFPIHAVLPYPVTAAQVERSLGMQDEPPR